MESRVARRTAAVMAAVALMSVTVAMTASVRTTQTYNRNDKNHCVELNQIVLRPAIDGGDDGRYRSPRLELQNRTATTVEPPVKFETTTHDRTVITAPLKKCPDGQRMYPDRTCGPDFVDPEDGS